ncbi:sensor histidine kinase [Streptomyces spirodelae]|uniref:histidine kinase n=1 Tax=Streptomyces spirodelae TaxID=2812904 RepID=A0ABS3X368_9ACTN|nr:ATP-binding protein [Streptomyces spirodelae]MBO8189825.1 ATP-binding protein [Streptomyces spirodelae]
MPEPPSSPTYALRDARAAVGVTGDAVLRRRMVRLVCTPALVVALAAAVPVAYLWSTRQPDAAAVDTGFGDAGSLAVALLAVAGALAFGVRGASAQARTTLAQYAALRRAAERSQYAIRTQLRRLEAGEQPAPPAAFREADLVPQGADAALRSLARELAVTQHAAQEAVVQAAALNRSGRAEAGGASAGEGIGAQGLEAADRVAVFVNLARRLQSLLHREIRVLDELENQVEDPEILKSVFQVDHLATRIRRYAENLAVLGGAVSRRQWTRPVPLTEILRSSAAEVEHYLRVKLVPPVEGAVGGHAVADVIHLLSELVENATVFSAPRTQVLVRVSQVTAGLAIEVEDRGLGMTEAEQQRMNALLADPDGVDVASLLSDGRIGLYVVGTLARRHGIAVQLRTNIYGGTQAVLVLPHSMLGGHPEADPERTAPAPGAPQPSPPTAGHEPTLRLTRSSGRHAAPPTAPASAPPGAGAGSAPWPRGEGRSAAGVADRGGPAVAVDGGGGEQRPPLPQRRRQQHIVPELREAPVAEAGGEERGHDPGLMAAFRRGVGRAESAAPEAGSHRPSLPDDGTGSPTRRKHDHHE